MTTFDDTSRPGTIATSRAASVRLLAPVGRLSLRAGEAAAAALSAALGFELPRRIGERAAAGGVEALRLGPDEWIVLADEPAVPRLIADCARLYADRPHSLTDISDREFSVRIEGPMAAELLALGCPRDIDRIGIGQGRRTVFDGVAVVLWRDAEARFRLDVWRSFAPHVIALLETGCAELALEGTDDAPGTIDA
ncbi:MAG: sarcosine oxidase subunit gamma family protein [Burkholderiaceae bacterium]